MNTFQSKIKQKFGNERPKGPVFSWLDNILLNLSNRFFPTNMGADEYGHFLL